MFQAAILQQTAEYIYQLEQQKTQLLSQNLQLKRLVDQQEGGEVPIKKRKGESQGMILFLKQYFSWIGLFNENKKCRLFGNDRILRCFFMYLFNIFLYIYMLNKYTYIAIITKFNWKKSIVKHDNIKNFEIISRMEKSWNFSSNFNIWHIIFFLQESIM